MIIPFVNIPLRALHLYQKPISMRFGEKKHLEICRYELKREPKVNELFLFYNSKRDTLKLFWLDETGSQELSKLPQTNGSFGRAIQKRTPKPLNLHELF